MNENNQKIIFFSILSIFVLFIAVDFFDTKQEESTQKKEIEIKKEAIAPQKSTKQEGIVVLPTVSQKTTNSTMPHTKIEEIKKTEATTEAEPVQYIKEHALKNISPYNEEKKEDQEVPRFSVYADIDIKEAHSMRNKFTPPQTPVMVSGAFPSGERYNVFIDADVKSQAKEIVVSNNQADGVITEIAHIPNSSDNTNEESQEMLLTPPSFTK